MFLDIYVKNKPSGFCCSSALDDRVRLMSQVVKVSRLLPAALCSSLNVQLCHVFIKAYLHPSQTNSLFPLNNPTNDTCGLWTASGKQSGCVRRRHRRSFLGLCFIKSSSSFLPGACPLCCLPVGQLLLSWACHFLLSLDMWRLLEDCKSSRGPEYRKDSGAGSSNEFTAYTALTCFECRSN